MQPVTTKVDRLAKNTRISLPTEVIEEILSRLPVKGGPLTHLMTLDKDYTIDIAQVEHLNGVVFCSSINYLAKSNLVYTFVVNPAMHKTF
ncbi:hypothetical protein Hanom_Chr02g00141381 [Helianthus anomalus]